MEVAPEIKISYTSIDLIRKTSLQKKKLYFTFNGHINRQALIFDYLIRKSIYSYEINKEILT